MSGPRPPAAAGVRPGWEEVPGRVRAAIEAWLDDGVTVAESAPGGFSPGLAARLQTRDGRRVFVKAVGPEPNPDSSAMHRKEAEVVRALPSEAPVPRLLWFHDEGEEGWVGWSSRMCTAGARRSPGGPRSSTARSTPSRPWPGF